MIFISLCYDKNFSYTEFKINSCTDNFILLLSYVYYLNIYKYLNIKVCIPSDLQVDAVGSVSVFF